MHNSRTLYLFNLSTDPADPILSFSWDWAEEFAKHFEQVRIYTTHSGGIKSRANIQVTEIGGGTLVRRFLASFRLLVALKSILSEKNKPLVFHHMSVNTAVIIGLPLKIAGIRQGLWYSHSSKNFRLKLALMFVTKAFSSTPSAFPFKSKKCAFIGHGIRVEDFKIEPARTPENDYRILSIGRITPIKRLERILQVVYEYGNPIRKVTFIGPTNRRDNEYKKMLLSLGSKYGIQLDIQDSVERKDIPKTLEQYGIFFTGTPKSTDKAAIEAAISGCYILSENLDTQKIVGMSDLWKKVSNEDMSLGGQLNFILNRSTNQRVQDRKLIQSEAAQLNDISNMIIRIIGILDARSK